MMQMIMILILIEGYTMRDKWSITSQQWLCWEKHLLVCGQGLCTYGAIGNIELYTYPPRIVPTAGTIRQAGVNT